MSDSVDMLAYNLRVELKVTKNVTIPTSHKPYATYIDEIEDYRSQGKDGDGYWVHLKYGYINTQSETHSIHEDNISQCLEIFKSGFIKPCGCQECHRNLMALSLGK